MVLRTPAAYDAELSVRKIAALACAVTLAWEYLKDSSQLFESLSLWTLVIHFAYFQLPFSSKVLPYLHTWSFIGAAVTPLMNGLLLLWHPLLEHMEEDH
jgi:hypothetical protein